MRIIKVKNDTGSDQTWVGQLISSGAYYEIKSNELSAWQNNQTLLTAVLSGTAVVNDGDKDYATQTEGLNWLKGINQRSSSDGSLIVEMEPLEGTKFTTVSPNWCDKTTWYEGSTRIVETLSSSDELIYVASNPSARVDVMHGKITGERLLRTTYAPSVIIDGVTGSVVESSPETTDGDYQYDYLSGTVTFNVARSPSEIIEISSSQVGSSIWTVKPKTGKKIRLTEVEVQFSADIELSDSIIFQSYGKVNDFAPQYTPAPYPSGTLIPLGNPVVYQTMHDYINEANLSYPIIPVLGGSGWRGMESNVHIFRWAYKASTDLDASRGMEVRIILENDQEFSGSFAVATFYGLSLDE